MYPKSLKRKSIPMGVSAIAMGLGFSSLAISAEEGGEGLEELVVVGTPPVNGVGLNIKDLPYNIQQVTSEELQASQHTAITDFANARMGSINLNSAQNNPLQPDLQFRGFTASPLLGLPQGIAVTQSGARVNEPLGDAINWDLIPLSAISSVTLHGGANPLFGLNTLGGAVSVEMKNGFNFSGNSISGTWGSWERKQGVIESGGNNGTWGYYINVDAFDEEGWRDESPSDALNVYASVSWRDGTRSGLNLGLQHGDSDLIGNGALPVGLVALDRDAIFTAPDITENDMQMVTLDGFHFISETLQFAGTAFYRANDSDAFNGDGSEFETCEFNGGGTALLEEPDDIEDALDDQLGIDLDNICEGNDPAITSFGDLETFIETQALLAALDPDDFELEDVSDELSGTGVISDEAINNISNRKQDSYGIDLQLTFLNPLFGRDNHLVVGAGYFRGDSKFRSVTELSDLDPVTRSTQGLGTGTFVEENAVRVKTSTETWSLYLSNTITLTEKLSLNLGARYNSTDVSLRDRSGERPELDGDHKFSRFNPTVGLTFAANDDTNLYASYSESSRAPTPIELACNEGVFEVARRFALLRGDDPDDIDFECRLPNAFLADPPLDQVVAKSLELGVRGTLAGFDYTLGLFTTDNDDDILFQSTGRATGLFANVDKTRRRGVEFSFGSRIEKLDWALNYSFIEATFESELQVLSPNHDFADAEGEIRVKKGDRIPGIPEHQLKMTGDYFLTEKITVGAEFIYNSDQVMRGDESNQLDEVDGYSLVNLSAAFAPTERFTIFVRVNNVFDKEYENFGLLGEDPSEVISLADTRPVFLGVGAPRAAWVGARLQF